MRNKGGSQLAGLASLPGRKHVVFPYQNSQVMASTALLGCFCVSEQTKTEKESANVYSNLR
jgi:hypothetical protein